jgi:hypothetical protein
MLLFKTLNILPAYEGHSGNSSAWKSLIGSLSLDYNFALVPLFYGMISVFYYLTQPASGLRKSILNVVLFFFLVAILFSGSRRGIITLACFVLFIIAIQVYTLVRIDSLIKKIATGSIWFLTCIIIVAFFSWYITFHTTYYFKNRALELIGSKDISSTKSKLAVAAYKYSSFVNTKNTYFDIYCKIWYSSDFDKSLDPDYGWGTRVHKTIFPLKGKNVEIVPNGSRGYLMDSTCNSSTWNGNAYSYTLIGNDTVKNEDIVQASVYCYVSEDFNGSWVQISSEGSTYGNTVMRYYIPDSIADKYRKPEQRAENSIKSSLLKEKNSEPEVENKNHGFIKTNLAYTNNLILNGNFKLGTQFWVSNANSTTHEIIETPFGKGIRVSRTNGDGAFYSLMYSGRPIVYYAGHEYKIKFNFKTEKGKGTPFKIGWWVKDSSGGFVPYDLPLKVTRIDNGWNEAECSYRFRETHSNLSAFLNSLQDYSVIDIANVEILDLDKDESLPPFVDELEVNNLKNKGIWQKLELRANCKNGLATVYLYFSRNWTKDFSSLKGSVIFAYPKYEIIRKKDTVSSYINIIDKNSKKAIVTIKQKSLKKNFASNSTDQFNRMDFLKDIIKDHPNRNNHGNQEKPTISYSKNSQIQAVLFSGLVPRFAPLILLPQDNDPVRKFASKFISEDTTYYDYKTHLIIDTVKSKVIGSRSMRWQFAWQIFSKEYNWRQKIFGGGFNFLNWYGYYFQKNKRAIDYPHNPFLSVLLYSGIFGLIIYLIFMFKVFYYYIRYFREYYILSMFFFITFFFSFFSAGSPFDPPVMGFFVMLSFFLNYIHNKPEQDRSSESKQPGEFKN